MNPLTMTTSHGRTLPLHGADGDEDEAQHMDSNNAAQQEVARQTLPESSLRTPRCKRRHLYGTVLGNSWPRSNIMPLTSSASSMNWLTLPPDWHSRLPDYKAVSPTFPADSDVPLAVHERHPHLRQEQHCHPAQQVKGQPNPTTSQLPAPQRSWTMIAKAAPSTAKPALPNISAPGLTTPRKRARAPRTTVISSDRGLKTPDQVKAALLATVDPARDQLRIKLLLPMQGGKILVETRTQAEATHPASHPGLASKGLRASRIPN